MIEHAVFQRRYVFGHGALGLAYSLLEVGISRTGRIGRLHATASSEAGIGESRARRARAFSSRLLRVRMSRQVNYHVNGATVSITPEEAVRLPRLYRIAPLKTSALEGTNGRNRPYRDMPCTDAQANFELGK
jgi:hypothetical protein